MSTSQSPLDSARSSQRSSQESSSKCKSVHKSSSIRTNGAKVTLTHANEDEDKSDGGTYTIDQDSNEVINARLSIDKTFGISTSEHKFKVSSIGKHPHLVTLLWTN